MISKNEKPVESRVFPFMILFAACCFLVYLLSNARPDVFFSGDAGLKFLVLKQMQQHGFFHKIDPDRQEWVNVLWAEGFYPFKPPFVYHLAGDYVVAFPPFFQWLNAPLYNLLGYRGLYIVPAASLFGLWCWFVYAMRRWNIAPLITSLVMIVLVFGSPLTIYAAMYWEHTLSILFSFAAIMFLVSEPASKIHTVFLGILTGCSGLLRPELLVFCMLFIFAALFNGSYKKNVNRVLFAASAGAVLVFYFCFNILVYHNALGAHGMQLIDESSLWEKLQKGLTLLLHLNAKFIAFFPVSLLFYFFVVHLLVRRPVMRPVVYPLVIISLLYALIVPFLVPNGGGKQWGPRYFLPLVPLMLAALCLSAGHIELIIKKHKWVRISVWLVLIAGFFLNSVAAASTLAVDYSYRVTPAMKYLKAEAADVVVVQNQYITQEFSALFDEKSFFLSDNPKTTRSLLAKLKLAGVREVIYISSAQEEPAMPNQLTPQRSGLRQVGSYFFAKYLLGP